VSWGDTSKTVNYLGDTQGPPFRKINFCDIQSLNILRIALNFFIHIIFKHPLSIFEWNGHNKTRSYPQLSWHCTSSSSRCSELPRVGRRNTTSRRPLSPLNLVWTEIHLKKLHISPYLSQQLLQILFDSTRVHYCVPVTQHYKPTPLHLRRFWATSQIRSAFPVCPVPVNHQSFLHNWSNPSSLSLESNNRSNPYVKSVTSRSVRKG
jgi:hypothetical protein